MATTTITYQGRKYLVRGLTHDGASVMLTPRYRLDAFAKAEPGVPYLNAGEIPADGEIIVALADLPHYTPPGRTVDPNLGLAAARARRAARQTS